MSRQASNRLLPTPESDMLSVLFSAALTSPIAQDDSVKPYELHPYQAQPGANDSAWKIDARSRGDPTGHLVGFQMKDRGDESYPVDGMPQYDVSTGRLSCARAQEKQATYTKRRASVGHHVLPQPAKGDGEVTRQSCVSPFSSASLSVMTHRKVSTHFLISVHDATRRTTTSMEHRRPQSKRNARRFIGALNFVG